MELTDFCSEVSRFAIPAAEDKLEKVEKERNKGNSNSAAEPRVGRTATIMQSLCVAVPVSLHVSAADAFAVAHCFDCKR